MSVAERILLAEDIWDSIAEFPEEIPLTKSQKQALDKRLESHRRNPSAGKRWHIVKKNLRKKA